jgi:hypothetical protein
MLPGEQDQAHIEYFFVARDSIANATTWPSLGTSSYRVGMIDIPDVQFPTAADSCASSLLVGQAVNVSGVVTHVAREYSDDYFYIQQGTAPNNGMRVSVVEGFVPDIGDRVEVAGVVREFMCQTQVEAFAGCVSVVDSGLPVVARLLGAIEDVELEQNESMLVIITGPIEVLSSMLTEVHNNVAYREFLVGSALNPVWVGTDTFEPDSIFYSVVPFQGLFFDSITGIVALRENFLVVDPDTRLRLEPRRDPDITVNYSNIESTPTLRTRLLPNRPNPFNPNTTIAYELAQTSRVRIEIFDATGARVRYLVASRIESAGLRQVVWDGRNDRGAALASGVYLIKLDAGTLRDSRKLHLLR